jgi:predicted HicB family RNase H-like nuclease
MTTVEYKGYLGNMEVDAEAGIIFGRVLGLRDVITFQGETVREAVESFHNSVDEYLAFCAERGREPERPFSGRILFRTSPERHRRMSLAAAREGMSLNAWLDALVAKATSDGQEASSDDPLVHALRGESARRQRATGKWAQVIL